MKRILVLAIAVILGVVAYGIFRIVSLKDTSATQSIKIKAQAPLATGVPAVNTAPALTTAVKAEVPLPAGLEIMQKSFTRDDGADGYFRVKMLLTDKSGDERRRDLEIYTKDYPNNLTKSYLKFTAPADIQGTGFLTLENQTGEDTQYLYLPELGRVRRIVASQKNLQFVNTDFTYEDMQRRRPEKDEHRTVREEIFDNYDCYVVESTPRDNSQYAKRIVWVDRESGVILKAYFFNTKGEHVKTYMVQDLDTREGIWTAIQVKMENLKTRHKTTMTILETHYNQGLDDALFTQENLEKK